jgi:hypothetical protein
MEQACLCQLAAHVAPVPVILSDPVAAEASQPLTARLQIAPLPPDEICLVRWLEPIEDEDQ